MLIHLDELLVMRKEIPNKVIIRQIFKPAESFHCSKVSTIKYLWMPFPVATGLSIKIFAVLRKDNPVIFTLSGFRKELLY